MNGRRRIHALTLALAVFQWGGCYQYVASPRDALRPGENVRLRLSEDAVEGLRPTLQSSPAPVESIEDRILEGRVASASRAEVILEVPWASVDRDGFSSRYLRQRIVLEPSQILHVDVRRMDQARTYTLVAGITAVAAVVVVSALTGESGGGGRDGPGAPDEAVIIRFPWPGR